MQGWAPSWAAMSIRSMQASAPATSAPTSSLPGAVRVEHGAVVDLVGVAVEQLGAARTRR